MMFAEIGTMEPDLVYLVVIPELKQITASLYSSRQTWERRKIGLNGQEIGDLSRFDFKTFIT